MAKTLLFLGTHEDIPYYERLKSPLAGHKVYIWNQAAPGTWLEVQMYCKKRGIEGIISTSPQLLRKLSQCEDAKVSNYAGSLFKRDGIEIVFVDPLKQFITVSYARFMFQRYVSKILVPEKWARVEVTAFRWQLLKPSNEASYFNMFKDAIAIAMDIENTPSLRITMISYTAIFNAGDNFFTETVVLPLDDPWALATLRKWNWQLLPPKIFQGGDYDNSYLLRYNAPVYNYLWDTMTMFHCWYAELPKDLGSLAAFFIRECMYWKDLGHSHDKMEQYKYNGLDTWGTANVFIQWMLEAPQWAKDNYVMEFPLMFPNILCGMTGIKRDMEALRRERSNSQQRIVAAKASLNKMLGLTNFNPGSPVQVKALLRLLGMKDAPDSNEKTIKKVMYAHPLNARILDKILEVRAHNKLVTTYLRTNEDANKKGEGGGKEFNGRVLYSIKGHGTDTGRNSCREHAFWCGVNIQNQPARPTDYVTAKECKNTYVADDGFVFGEVDLEQAESRDTAFISGDTTLITNVTGDKDFHSINASAFFGRNYYDIYDDSKKKTKDKALRDLAKRVNHGSNYNMGPDVLVDTMGLSKIYEAARLLNLPKFWAPRQIAEYLLSSFHKTYPTLKTLFYPSITKKILLDNLLVGATNWTRYCFGRPDKNKQDLNAYIAHHAQSLNAMVLNKAFLKVFYDIALAPEHSNNFKLLAQIHDSILFQYRVGHEYLVNMVKERMEIPVTVKSYAGPVYTFTVPAAAKKDGKYWGDL